jgi:hypothetical protein
MTTELDENMEAALLAGLVKSKMRKIDSLMESRPDIPADRIDLNTFVRQAQQPVSIQPQPVQQIHNQAPSPSHIQQTAVLHQPQIKEVDEETKTDIKNILITLEKINNNLTKLSGMFGKVFHSLTKNK